MVELLILIVTVWLGFKVIGLLFKAAWGITKILALILFALAIPVLLLCLVFAAGMFLVVPACMIAISIGLLKRVV